MSEGFIMRTEGLRRRLIGRKAANSLHGTMNSFPTALPTGPRDYKAFWRYDNRESLAAAQAVLPPSRPCTGIRNGLPIGVSENVGCRLWREGLWMVVVGHKWVVGVRCGLWFLVQIAQNVESPNSPSPSPI